jgi:hypothetical protein
MFKGQLFQLNDKYCDQIGLIFTPDTKIKENTVEDLWHEFCQSYEADADNFVTSLNQTLNNREDFTKEFPNGIFFERVFAAETNV